MDLFEELDVMDHLNDVAINNHINNAQILNDPVFLAQTFKRKYTIRNRLDPFEEYDEPEFKRRYRLSKRLAIRLYELIDGINTLEPMVCINGWGRIKIRSRFLGNRNELSSH